MATEKKVSRNDLLCCTVIPIVLIVLLLLIGVFLYTQQQRRCGAAFEGFASTVAKTDPWPQRWKDLNDINPDKFRSYFVLPVDFQCIPHRNVDKPGWIFISIASYRDEQCLDSLNSLANNADHPERLHFVICQQNSILEPDCECRKDVKITIERLKDTDARGPTWARFRIQQHYSGEEFVLQIDAHTRMAKSWDTILKTQLDKCPAKSVLTQYPCEFDIVPKADRNDPNKENWRSDKLRGGMFVEKIGQPDGFVRIQSLYTNDIPRGPFRASAWAAGFSFSRAEFILDVPYDPCTPFLFFGEEMDIAIRGFTHGYDFYSPSVTVVFHNYKRKHRKTFWENPLQKPLEILSRFRIYARLKYINPDDIPDKYAFILTQTDKFPIGNERTIEEYEKFAKINIKNESKLS
jgi:hypothetical protein